MQHLNFRIFITFFNEFHLKLYFLEFKMKDLRPAIIRAHEKGKGVREIARFLDIEPSTVSLAIKRFEETGSNEDRKRNRENQQEAEEMFSAPFRRKGVCDEASQEC